MNTHSCPRSRTHRDQQSSPSAGRVQNFLRRWFLANSLIAGVCALLWLVLRSGPKPSRFAYPCQQAAVSAATLAFGAPVVAAFLALRRRVVATLLSPGGIVVAGLGLSVTVGIWGYLARADSADGAGGLRLEPPRVYRAQVFQITDCPQAPVGDNFVGLDNLITLMGREGLKFYQSAIVTPEAGPDGIIAANDVVVVKINYQWGDRGGTNTDVLRGLIRRIVDHPDNFTGEVVVCENSQFNSINGFNRSNNNAEVYGQSPHDVVVAFQAEGHTVSHYDWTVRRTTLVTEYSTGNMTDGYVRYAYDSQLNGRVSYPKFRTDDGTYISLRDGIWDTVSGTYDREGLKFINLPVLKSHHATYGATACVKHYMGVVSGELSTNSHSAIGNGILGALLGEIQLADLNILDCIWINANPYDGPWTSYAAATRIDQLVASVDPVAADIWAVKNILIPAFLDRGYSPPWPYPSADPDLPNSSFRRYLDNSMDYILAAGYDATNDLDQIDAYTWDGKLLGDYDGDGNVDVADYPYFETCLAGPGRRPVPGPPVTLTECLEVFDFDGDGDVDLGDFAEFAGSFDTAS